MCGSPHLKLLYCRLNVIVLGYITVGFWKAHTMGKGTGYVVRIKSLTNTLPYLFFRKRISPWIHRQTDMCPLPR